MFLLMYVTRHHTKYMLHYEYLTSARTMYIFSMPTSVGICDGVIKYSAPIFLQFCSVFDEFMQ